MISLIAAAFEDGWAFVRQGYTIYLLRPPFQRRGLVEVSAQAVERAIHVHGFQPELLPFADWGALIDFMRKKIVETAAAHAERTKEAKAAARLLRHAGTPVLEGYLDRIEQELLPAREHEAALRLLTALGGLEKVAADPALHARTTRLLERAVEEITQPPRRDPLAEDPATMARAFPLASERYGSGLLPYIRAVRERGYVMAIGE